MQKDKSFTLIELLVVIAIIGLLSSIVLVSLKGVRERAKIAKTLEFSQSIQNALGSEAVGIWSFDEGSGSTAKDSSGYGNNGTLVGNPQRTDDTPHKVAGTGSGKNALSFDGIGNYVSVSGMRSISRPFTIELWLKIPLPDTWRYLLARGNGTTLPIILQSSGAAQGEKGKMLFRPQCGASYTTAWTKNILADGSWHHLVGVHTTSQVIVYEDGVQGNTYSAAFDCSSEDNFLFMTNIDKTSFCAGFLDEVRIYSQALTLGEIQKHYAEGLEKHEYAKR